MEYIYASLILHQIGNEITEDKIEKILTAAGAQINKAQIKAVIASLEGVNIDEAIKSAVLAAPTATATPAETTEAKAEEKKEEKKEEEEKPEEVQGLGALFG
ncbi:MAG: 50S ribosomal protein P1 [Candidatus Helarchaeota archaeon]